MASHSITQQSIGNQTLEEALKALPLTEDDSLDISGYPLTLQDINLFTSLKIKQLNVSGTYIGDTGVELLLAKDVKIKELILDNLNLSESVLPALEEAEKNGKTIISAKSNKFFYQKKNQPISMLFSRPEDPQKMQPTDTVLTPIVLAP